MSSFQKYLKFYLIILFWIFTSSTQMPISNSTDSEHHHEMTNYNNSTDSSLELQVINEKGNLTNGLTNSWSKSKSLISEAIGSNKMFASFKSLPNMEMTYIGPTADQMDTAKKGGIIYEGQRLNPLQSQDKVIQSGVLNIGAFNIKDIIGLDKWSDGLSSFPGFSGMGGSFDGLKGLKSLTG